MVSPLHSQLWIFQDVALEDIDDLGLFVHMIAICIHVVKMDMPMQEISGLEPLHECQKGGEPLMTSIGIIT